MNVGMDMALKNFAIYYDRKAFVSTKYKTLSKIGFLTVGEYEYTFIHNSIPQNEKISEILKFIPQDADLFIEGYSFGSVSNRALQGAEFIGALKYMLSNRGNKITVVNPSTLKKTSTGKGNADKLMMFNHANEEIKNNIISLINYFEERNISLKIKNQPISDIIDAYWLSQAR